MSDTAIADAPAEPVPPAPEAAAELEAARPDAEATVPAEAPADASVLPEIEHPIGPIRQAILDHLLDSEGPQTVAQFIAALGNFSRGPVETALKREYDAGRIERIAPGTYVLAPPKPPEPPKRPSASPPAASLATAAIFSSMTNFLESWCSPGVF